MPGFPARGLYAITGRHDEDANLIAWARAVLEGGAVCLQYREKHADAAGRLARAEALAGVCRSLGRPLLVNDDPHLAAEVGAAGVHLGRDDPGIEAARALLGADALIGVSCYGDAGRAAELAARGADYLAFGAFAPSRTKPEAAPADPAVLAIARRHGVPLVAIGGITPDNGGALLAAGADLLAVIDGLAGTPDQARDAARRYASLFAAPDSR
ncbi:MAG: thiamine phosphate synthase [Xanthomonadales bacterium]|nr:thiamine phosphate synthase [Xanthomonadales bacterium]